MDVIQVIPAKNNKQNDIFFVYVSIIDIVNKLLWTQRKENISRLRSESLDLNGFEYYIYDFYIPFENYKYFFRENNKKERIFEMNIHENQFNITLNTRYNCLCGTQ